MIYKIKKLVSVSLAIMLVVAVGVNFVVAQEQELGQDQGETVVDKLADNDKISVFAELVEQSGFTQVLVEQGPYTVLAPTNDALAEAEIDIDAAKEDQSIAQQVVQSHLYQGEIPTDEVESSMGVGVKDTDNSASNGVIYVVDRLVE